ncbi:hypothetical protein HYY72_02490 [Candidatus Woesearchaeota archaeon]|nr:hypothetical protein [Candidatus Woesearchaeota archaeon]
MAVVDPESGIADIASFLSLRPAIDIRDSHPELYSRQIRIQVSNGSIVRASAFSLEYLLGLSGLPEQEFLGQYWKPAYDYLKRITGYAGKPVLSEPETYGSQYSCIDLAIRHGFVPTKLGARIIELRRALTKKSL